MRSFIIATLCLFGIHGAWALGPAWWTQPDTEIVQSGATEDNYAVATVGQLKWVATRAKTYLDQKLSGSGGAGASIDDLVASFKPQVGVSYTKAEEDQIRKDNYSVLNIGQLKAVTKVFYDRLIAAGYNTKANLVAYGYRFDWPYNYPWNPSTPVSTNYSPATVGQLKLAFCFDLDSGTPPTIDTVATPVLSPGGGTYTDSVYVSMTTATPDATIRYTLDGSDPSQESQLYSVLAPISITATTAIKAAAFKLGMRGSNIASQTYTIIPSGGVGQTFDPFDYVVIRYKWAGTNGIDLDTRTALTNTSPLVDLQTVGWARQSNVSDGTTTYLDWTGDNTGTGQEAVLVDFKAIKQNFPESINPILRMRAFWFNTENNGDATVEITTYLGGTMQKVGFDYVNAGGSVVQVYTFATHVTQHGSSNLDGEDVGYLTFDTAINGATLQALP